MKNKRFLCIVLILILFILWSLEAYSATPSYFATTFSASDTNIGDATLCLKKGFDFVESDSSHYNYELALTAATLSAQVYPAANGDKASDILKKLGYDKVSNVPTSMNQFPAVSYAYKRLENGKNVFAVVVRGTVDRSDMHTDAQAWFSMFAVAGQNIIKEMGIMMEGFTGKTLEEIKREDNYFFFTGHSLGGAVANYMSINETVMGYVNSDKGKIYTYTFESPHTCVALWWLNPESMSNAFNFKVDGDVVTNYPFRPGSTTYGKDMFIKASELNDNTLRSLFVNSKVSSIDGNIGLHDTCLPLIYILDQAKKDGKDISWVFKDPNELAEQNRDSMLDYDELYQDYAKKLQSGSDNQLYMKIFNSDEPMLLITDGVMYRSYENGEEGYCSLVCDIYQYAASDEKIVYIGKFTSNGTARPIRWRKNSIQAATHHQAWSLSAKNGIGYVYAVHDVLTENSNAVPEGAQWTLKNGEWEKTQSESISKSVGDKLWYEYYGNGKVLFFEPVK